MAIRRVALLGAVLAAVLLAHPASCESDNSDDGSDNPDDWSVDNDSSPDSVSDAPPPPPRPFVCSAVADPVLAPIAENCNTGTCSYCNPTGGMCAACKGLESVLTLCKQCANCVMCGMCTNADCVDPVPRCVWDNCDPATSTLPTTCPALQKEITTGCLAPCTDEEKGKLKKFFEEQMPEYDDLATCHALWYEGADWTASPTTTQAPTAAPTPPPPPQRQGTPPWPPSTPARPPHTPLSPPPTPPSLPPPKPVFPAPPSPPSIVSSSVDSRLPSALVPSSATLRHAAAPSPLAFLLVLAWSVRQQWGAHATL